MKMMKNERAITTITLGMMIIIPTTLTPIVVPVVAARNGKLAVDPTVPIKNINGVARGNVKEDVCDTRDLTFPRIIPLITRNVVVVR